MKSPLLKYLPIVLAAAAIGYSLRSEMSEDLSEDWANLQAYRAANDSLPAPTLNRPRVVLMGNSIIEGWRSTDPGLFRTNPYELIPRGISGQATPQMLLRFRQDVVELKPQAVVILGGINDIAENAGPYREQATLNNLISMSELAQASGIRVVLCSVLPASDLSWRKSIDPTPKVVALNRRIRAFAGAHGLPYIDFHTRMANSEQGLQDSLGKDGIHPNRKGYKVMGPLLLSGIAQALER